MKKLLPFLLLIPFIAFAAPTTTFFTNIAPTTANTYNDGTASLPWLNFYTKYASTTQITVSGQTSGCAQFNAVGFLTSIGTNCGSGSGTVSQINTNFPILGGPITTTGTLTFGGLSTSSAAVVGNIPYFSGANTFANVATSTLTATSPLTGSFTYIGTGGALGCQVASGSQAGCLSSTDWTTFNGKQAAGNYITALTGDVTASGPGSAAATLATVNSNVGSFTYGSFTVNGKGLITAASSGVAPVTALGSGWATTTAATITFATTTQSFNGLTFAQKISVPSAGSLLFTPNISGTLDNTGLTNSSITVNSTSIALGASGTITAASSTILANNNTWSGQNRFAFASTTLGSISNFYSGLTGVLIGNGANSLVTAGTAQTCTNQFMRSMSALYIGSCATVSLTADITGTLPVANGGTGSTSFGQGWLSSSGGTAALTASTSPTVNYITSTSTTATSTFAFSINTTSGGVATNNAYLSRFASIFSTSTPGTNISVVFTGSRDSVPAYSAGTLTLPSNTSYISVELWGAGAGGGGAASTIADGGDGAAGGASCFGTNVTACTSPILTTNGGLGGGKARFATQLGGVGGISGTATGGDFNASGQSGGVGPQGSSGAGGQGGGTGGSASRGGGGGGNTSAGSTGQAGAGPGGGGGGGSAQVTTAGSGGGGGAGGYSLYRLTLGASTYYYTIGAGGIGGTDGSGGAGTGGKGAPGGILVTVYTY